MDVFAEYGWNAVVLFCWYAPCALYWIPRIDFLLQIMKFSKNSRLVRSYRFHSKSPFVGDDYWNLPTDLCTFVKNYLLIVCKNTFIILTMLFCLVSSLSTIYVWLFDGGNAAIDGIPFLEAGRIVCIISSATLCIAAGISLMFWCMDYIDNLADKRKNQSSSLIVEYIRAKKNKYCPRIEYE